jgi:hypothetical protein
MAPEGNGKPVLYQISISGDLVQHLKTLRKRAQAVDLGNAYDDALRSALYRLQHDPWGFGELIGDLKYMRLKIHVGVIKPLLIEFAIHEERPLVFVKRVLFTP